MILNWISSFFNDSSKHCGSGGCTTAVFITEKIGSYRFVLNLFGSQNPRISNNKTNDFKDILSRYYSTGGPPVWNVYQWSGTKYELAHFEFCDKSAYEYCVPQLIDLVPQGWYVVEKEAIYYNAPYQNAQRATDNPSQRDVIGKLKSGGWFFVITRVTGIVEAAFVQVDHRHCRPAADETMLGLQRAVGTEVDIGVPPGVCGNGLSK
jgi:hypothetical protein